MKAKVALTEQDMSSVAIFWIDLVADPAAVDKLTE